MKFRVGKVEAGDRFWPLVCEHFPRAVRRLLDPSDQGEYHFFVAIDMRLRFLGGAVIDVGPIGYGPLAGRMAGFLEDIEVGEPFRRQGVGTALLRAALDYYWDREAGHVRWTVACANTVGVVFYDSLGLAMLPDSDPENPEDKYYLVVATSPFVGRIYDVSGDGGA